MTKDTFCPRWIVKKLRPMEPGHDAQQTAKVAAIHRTILHVLKEVFFAQSFHVPNLNKVEHLQESKKISCTQMTDMFKYKTGDKNNLLSPLHTPESHKAYSEWSLLKQPCLHAKSHPKSWSTINSNAADCSVWVLLVLLFKLMLQIWNRTRPSALVQNQQTQRQLAFKIPLTQVQQQRPESPTVTLTRHACKHKVHKLHQRYIDDVCTCGGVHVPYIYTHVQWELP